MRPGDGLQEGGWCSRQRESPARRRRQRPALRSLQRNSFDGSIPHQTARCRAGKRLPKAKGAAGSPVPSLRDMRRILCRAISKGKATAKGRRCSEFRSVQPSSSASQSGRSRGHHILQIAKLNAFLGFCPHQSPWKRPLRRPGVLLPPKRSSGPLHYPQQLLQWAINRGTPPPAPRCRKSRCSPSRRGHATRRSGRSG